MEEIFKQRQSKFERNISSQIIRRAELHKLSLRKNQLDEYIEMKRFKSFESPLSLKNNSNLSQETIIDFKELSITRELKFSEILTKIKVLIESGEDWFTKTTSLKECMLSLRKLTCRGITTENNLIVSNKIHIVLFDILSYYKNNKDLSEIETSLIYECLWALSNIVCHSNIELFDDIKKRNDLLVLKDYLYFSTDKIIDQVTVCIGNIVAESKYFRESALNIGILEKVEAIARDTSKPIVVVRNSIFLISNLYRGLPHPENEKILPSLNIVSAYLWKNDEEIVKTCLWSISYLSDGTEKIQNSIVSTGCLPKILEYVKIKNKNIQMPCLRILGNLAAGSTKIAEKLIEYSLLKIIIDLIKQCEFTENKKELVWILNNLSQSSVSVVNIMVENEKLNEIFKNMLETGDDTTRYQVFTILYNYAKYGNITTVTKLIEMGVIQMVIYIILNVPHLNPHTRIIGMGLINRLLKTESLTMKLKEIIINHSILEKLLNINHDDTKTLTQLVERAIESTEKIISSCDGDSYMNIIN